MEKHKETGRYTDGSGEDIARNVRLLNTTNIFFADNFWRKIIYVLDVLT